MEDLPLCTFPEVRTYIDGSILRCCVCFRVVYSLQVGRRTVAAVEYSGVWLFLVSEFLAVPVSLCYQIEAGISWDKPLSGSWQNVRLSRLRGSEMCFFAGRNYCGGGFFCPEGACLLVPTENIRIALILYGKVVSDYNSGHWDSTCLTFNFDTPMIFCKKGILSLQQPIAAYCFEIESSCFFLSGLPCFIWLLPLFPIRLWLFREILWNANGAKQNVIAAVWWLRGRTNDVPTPGSGRV